MANSRSYPIDFVPGLSSADALNLLPRGNLVQGERNSNESNIDGLAIVITRTLVIPEDGRRQRVIASVMVRSETIGGVQARVAIDDAQIQRRNQVSLGGGADVSWEFSKDVELDAGTYTVDLIVGRSGAGSNLVSCIADGDEFGTTTLYIDDIGPAYAA